MYDRDSLQVIDYQQFYANLSEANIQKKISWKLEYEALSAYNMKDLSAESWMELVMRAVKDEDTFQLLWRHYWSEHTQSCGFFCKREFLCSLYKVTLLDYEECVWL
jgi:hypothetical protein